MRSSAFALMPLSEPASGQVQQASQLPDATGNLAIQRIEPGGLLPVTVYGAPEFACSVRVVIAIRDYVQARTAAAHA
jgi:hypothetical protein